MSNWDQSKFDAALEVYVGVCSRTCAEAINTKAYFIARKALWFTKKADEGTILDGLFRTVSATRKDGSSAAAPLVAAIINKSRGRRGEDGLYGAKMAKAMAAFYAKRLKSIAFLKSGWLPAIEILGLVAKDKSKAAPQERGVKQFGVPRGTAYVASESRGEIFARIINAAIAKNDKKGALEKYGGPALQRAFDDEATSMLQYVEEKLAPGTAAANKALS